MTSLGRFTRSIVPFLLVGACAELIGLSDYETGEAEDNGGESTGGRSGTTGIGGTVDLGGKPGSGGEDDGGAGASTTGGRIIRPTGGTSGDGGMGGEPDGGDGGKGGVMPTGGTPPMGGAGGAGGSGGAGSGGGGTGGSPVCAEITMAAFVDSILDDSVLPAVAAYDFGIVPALGTTVQDFFEIQFWDSQGSGSYDGALTGSFPLGPGPDSNYAFCSRCVVVFQDYGSATREKMFFATEGTLNVALGSQQMLGYPDMTLTDVTLSEVTIDENGISTLVPGGECLHLETASHRIPPPDDWTCNIAWYMDADCDCGCGQFDPTCTSSQLAACRYCWCDTLSACAAGEVDPASNWQCN